MPGASEEPPTPSELQRQVDDHKAQISQLHDHVGDLGERVTRVEVGVNKLERTVEAHRAEAHQDSQTINETLQAIRQDLGGKAEAGDAGNGGVKARVERATGAVRFGRWLIATLVALGSMAAMWWEKLVAVGKAVLLSKGGP